MENLYIAGWIGLNLLLLLSAYALCMRILGKSTRASIVIGTATLYFTQIILIEIILGTLGLLTLPYVLALGTVLSLTAIIALRHSIKKPLPHTATRNFAMLFLMPLALLVVGLFFTGLLQAPMDFDSNAYHLPFVAEWLKTGNILTPYYTAFSGPIGNYPANYELLDLWVMLPFQSDILTTVLNVPMFVLLLFAVYHTARRNGLSIGIAVLSAAIIGYMPVFLRQINLSLVDTFFTMSWVIVIYFMQEYYKKPGAGYALLAGFSAGLFVGTKYLGIIYGVPLILVLLIGVKRNWGPALTGVLITGSFFYLRNLILTGNPLFPAPVSAAGLTIFEGYPNTNSIFAPSSLFENVRSLAPLKEFLTSWWHLTGSQGVLLLMGLFVSPLFMAWQYYTKKRRYTPLLCFFAASICIFALYWIAPYTYRDLGQNIRYAMPFLVLATLHLGLLAQHLAPRIFQIAIALLLAHTLIWLIIITPNVLTHNDILLLPLSLFTQHAHALLIFLIALLSGILALILKPTIPRLALASLALVLSLYIFSTAHTQRTELKLPLARHWYPDDQPLYHIMQAANWLDLHAKDANIAYTGFNFHYPLYGDALRRSVDYININDCTYCRYFEYKTVPGGIRSEPDFEAWLNNLRSHRKTHLITRTPAAKYEYAWASTSPHFTPLWQKDGLTIFRIK